MYIYELSLFQIPLAVGVLAFFCSMLVAFYTLNELRGMDRGRAFSVCTRRLPCFVERRPLNS